MNIPILIIIFIFIIFLNQSDCSLNIPFESKLCKGNENTDFLSNYYGQYLYTPIKIGSNNQRLEVALKLNKYITYLIGSQNSNLKSEYFLEQNSISYAKLDEKEIKSNEDMFISGIKSTDNFIFGENINYEKYLFYLSKEQIFDETGQIGLKLMPSEKYFSGESFIEQLKAKSLINTYNFYFKYELEDEEEFKFRGNLIIGGMPHEIEHSDLFKEDNYVKTYSKLNEHNSRWTIEIKTVQYGNEVISKSDIAEFSTTFGFITGPLSFLDIFDKFFNKTNCYSDYNGKDKNYLYFYCEQNVDISKFKDIFFTTSNKELNFTLTYKDLFKKIGKYYYFLILFNEDINQWEFGHIFLNKYMMVFNSEDKTIGYYYQSNFQEKKNSKKYNYVFIIVSIFFGIIIIGLLIYIFYFSKKNRKIRPNELEENFDYCPSDEDKQENKLGV